MRENNLKEPKESEKVFALTVLLMNVLILTVVVGMFWLVRMIVLQGDQLRGLTRGFNF